MSKRPTFETLRTLTVDVVKIAASGFKVASSRARKERLAICATCPMHVDDRCAVCSCYTTPKAAFAVEACPLGFWDHIPPNLQEGEQLVAPAEPPPQKLADLPPAPYVDTAEFERRSKICEGCEFRRGRRCDGCACDIYTMARLTKSQCPKEKW